VLMKVGMRRRIVSFLVVLGWAISSAAFTLGTIFQGQLLPRNINGGGLYGNVIAGNSLVLFIFFAGGFVVSLIAAMQIGDLEKSIISFFASYIGCAMITYAVLVLPDLAGVYDPAGAIAGSGVTFTFGAMFPLFLLFELAGTIVGVALGGAFL
jgi:hypothetical protein